MGKRSDFQKIEKDAYMTFDKRAASPLLSYYNHAPLRYYEPCAGNGDLISLLDSFVCAGHSDDEIDARISYYKTDADYFITNPPWSRRLLHPIIENLRNQLPAWLLFDADWMHTQQAIPYMQYCKTILSVGRLKWIPDSPHDGKDNCAWYLFVDYKTKCEFIPRSTP
jgi:hypothetical protein